MVGSVQKVNARELALEALLSAMGEGVYLKTALHQILHSHKHLSKQDRAFVTRLTNGVMERKMELDYVVKRYSNVPIRKIRPVPLNILRMGIYQILYMEWVPDHAACYESVELAKKKGFHQLKGFVNGVLRSIARNKAGIPYPDKRQNKTEYYSVRYSVPEWMVCMWLDALGEEVMEAMLRSYLEENVTTLRCNTEKISPEEWKRALEEAGIAYEHGIYHSDTLRIKEMDTIMDLPGYQEGWFLVQDESSMFPVTCAGVEKDWKILDVCAAPGGKALYAAQTLRGSGKVWACDITEYKLGLLRDNLNRMDYNNVEIIKQDALELRTEWVGKMDLVIADLPCSGFGVIGKKSDIKYRVNKEDLVDLQTLQRRMLTNACKYVKPGGVLIYSTCTVQSGENEENAFWITENLPFVLESLNPYLPKGLWGKTTENGYLQLIPGIHACDGFFFSRLRKQT